MNGVIIAGFVMLLAVAPLALFADPRLGAGLACCLAALALWRAAALQERERKRRARPADASSVIRQLSAWLVQRRREPIASERALERGREYATGVQDGAYAILDDVIDRLAETLRLLPPARRRSRPAAKAGSGEAGKGAAQAQPPDQLESIQPVMSPEGRGGHPRRQRLGHQQPARQPARHQPGRQVPGRPPPGTRPPPGSPPGTRLPAGQPGQPEQPLRRPAGAPDLPPARPSVDRPWRPPEARRSADPGAVPTRAP